MSVLVVQPSTPMTRYNEFYTERHTQISKYTIKTVKLPYLYVLVQWCDNLKRLKEVINWIGIKQGQRQKFLKQKLIPQNNIQLHLLLTYSRHLSIKGENWNLLFIRLEKNQRKKNRERS